MDPSEPNFVKKPVDIEIDTDKFSDAYDHMKEVDGNALLCKICNATEIDFKKEKEALVGFPEYFEVRYIERNSVFCRSCQCSNSTYIHKYCLAK
jgi:hypothetical protein